MIWMQPHFLKRGKKSSIASNLTSMKGFPLKKILSLCFFCNSWKKKDTCNKPARLITITRLHLANIISNFFTGPIGWVGAVQFRLQRKELYCYGIVNWKTVATRVKIRLPTLSKPS